MTPWEETGAELYVLRDKHRQYSLWPDFADFPDGWVSVFGPASAADCRAYLAGDRRERDLDS
ncbi:MbtH family protein [Pseudoclavibacter sp. AY1F1]|uniref:MbtH family NRPS accessory protein n=1 Tax=Pseudoclavibacter sp. AY1F1 TaxID=2080583 RepID=UPI000CE73989|nr:MbtH family NRPS accessory protein [Pseudoclavibacter sp. AY1F1]PPF45329.1 MbtH family protein [Pseudoclavibacter sp. AY1F1]